MSLKDKVPPGYRSKDLIDKRGEFKRKRDPDYAALAKKADLMQSNLDKMDLRALKNILTKRTVENLEYAKGKKRR